MPPNTTAGEAKCEDLEEVVIDDDPDKFFRVGARLPFLEKEKLIEFLKRNIDVFAWDACDASGIDLAFICHHLNVNPAIIPKKQPSRRLSKEHADAIKDEVAKLKCARAIKEVFYPEWLANTVVVKKKSGKWQACVDFTDLNKVPQGPVPNASDRPASGRNSKPSSDELLRRLSRLSPNTTGAEGSRENGLRNANRK